MLLKVFRHKEPQTREGRAYTPEDMTFLWDRAQRLPVLEPGLEPGLQARLKNRQADKQLWKTVRNWAGRRSVFTLTGRLRANTTFCSARNCLFQGVAADGALLGLWLVWRKGYTLVDFVHDQLVVETPADDQVWERAREVEELMKQGMLMVVPGMNVKVETVISRWLNKKELDPR
jgi:hypothetical protein